MATMPLTPTSTAPPPTRDPDEQKPLRLKPAQPDIVIEEVVGGAEQARADLHVQTVCLLILAFVATGVALYLLRPVLVPFVLALFFAACLRPVIIFQIRYLRFPQPLAVVGAALVAAALCTGIGITIGQQINQMRPTFEHSFDVFQTRAAQSLPLQRFGLKPNFQLTDSATRAVFSTIGEVTGVATGTILVIIFTLFILFGRRTGPRQHEGVLGEIEIRVQRYISQMVMLSAITGILVATILGMLGVRYAAVFGFLAFLLNFIPTIGSIIATLLPLPIILVSPELGPVFKILALAVPAGMQIYLGNAVQPRVLGNALDLHPIVVLISLIFWGMIWGVAGAFLATPMTAVLKIVLEKIPATRPLAALLAGRIDLVF